MESEKKPKKKPGLKLNITEPNLTGVSVSDAGSLKDGDISINMDGLRISQPKSGTREAVDTHYRGMKHSDFEVKKQLGEGSSGVVQLVKYTKTNELFALKVIPLGCNQKERKQILLELKTLHQCEVEQVISFKGALYAEGAIYIVLEFMDRGSLGAVLNRKGAIPEVVLAKMTEQLLLGLTYLHKDLKIVHRDIKPSNILLNSAGQVKLADFGMSGQLESTFSQLASWVGTAAYMSPERISGSEYSFDSDVWSLGISLWECAVGGFPYGTDVGGPQGEDNLLPEERSSGIGFWDLLHHIVEEEPPPLPSDRGFSANMIDFVDSCIRRKPSERPSAESLLKHPWIVENQSTEVSIEAWIQEATQRTRTSSSRSSRPQD